MIYLVITSIFLLLIFFGALFEAPWVPTRKVDYERIDKLAGLKSGQTFYDLGSGFSGLLIHLAQKHQKSRFVGVEIAILPYLISKLRTLNHSNIKIVFGDLKRLDISRADVAYLFLRPETLPRVQKKLMEELKPEAKIITACWGFDFSQEDIVEDQPRTGEQAKYFVYTAKELLQNDA
jgi:predicted RNA methylase